MIVNITAHPYATVYGTIEVPDGVEDIKAYIDEHFDDIDFGNPDIDYQGTDYDIDS